MTRKFVLMLGVASFFVVGCDRQKPDTTPAVSSLTVAVTKATGHKHEFKGTREEAQEFMKANREISLTPAQEHVRLMALDEKDSTGKPVVPAPCCADKTAATCCCECNLARTIWGLSKSLIVSGADATEVREAVQDWTRTLNPAGYAGDACYVGRCNNSLKSDACG